MKYIKLEDNTGSQQEFSVLSEWRYLLHGDTFSPNELQKAGILLQRFHSQ